MTTDPGLIPALGWWEYGPTVAGVTAGEGPARTVTDQPSATRRRRVGFVGDLEWVEEDPPEPLTGVGTPA